MIRYQTFRNDDPPALAAIWRNQGLRRALAQPMTPSLLESHVLGKPYFDREGLIVAVGEEGPVGFAHAAFGAKEDRSDIDRQIGVICLVMVDRRPDRETIARSLLSRCEDYLQANGALVLHAGQSSPHDPFYKGLFGGSELSGIPRTDEDDLRLFQSAGYVPTDEVSVLQLDIAHFRPPIDRGQLLIGRCCNMTRQEDPPAADWWEACTWGETHRYRFELCSHKESTLIASVTYWEIEPLASSWGVHAIGVTRLLVIPDSRREGRATYLMGQSLKQLHQEGVTLAEAHVSLANRTGLALFGKLGFQEIDRGIVLRKDV